MNNLNWFVFVYVYFQINTYTPPLHSIGSPAKKHPIQTPAVTRQWWSIRCGHLSVIARHNASIPPNCEPMPNINIIIKNNTAHSCGNGISSTASGYAINTHYVKLYCQFISELCTLIQFNSKRSKKWIPINARPGPLCTTSETSICRLFAMNPSMPNTAKPQKMAVNTFMSDTTSVSVWQLFLN